MTQKKFSPEQVAAAFGVTVDSLRPHYAAAADSMLAIAARAANAKTGKHRGFTQQHARTIADDMHHRAITP